MRGPSDTPSGIPPDFCVGSIPVYGDVILSPMSGFSDMPYRSICRRLGSAMSYTEFVSALALVQGERNRSMRMLSYQEMERPVVFQLFDNDEDRLVRAARSVCRLQPDVIDINMGCSVRHVSGRGAGAGLLREPSKIARIFKRLVKELPLPVTGKIRLGWERKSQNYLEVARILEDCGAALIAVHARTRDQAYDGVANWDAIAEVVQAVRVPVIGNGDVRTVRDIQAIKSHTGCSAVMIGRGAMGNPWIFQRRNREEVPLDEKVPVVVEHARLMSDFYGEKLGMVLFRKHVARYWKGYTGLRDLQYRMVRVASLDELESLLEQAAERVAATPECHCIGDGEQ